MNEYLEIRQEIREAIENNQPVVALESTIISHGMPFPQNYETALKVEEIVKENGATPATVAILNGKIKVGLNKSDIHHLASERTNIFKCSRRDIPYLLSQKIDGATTVASTMIAAEMAGIKIFATGGVGGVHRGASETMDVSADLQELSKTNVAVVCAGAKSILDIGLTLEYLETHGVPVIGFGTKEMPAFYTQKSDFEVDFQIDNLTDVAMFMHTKWTAGLTGGLIIANPIPMEYQLDYDEINHVIKKALQQANSLGIKGKDSTPFLLEKVKELTGGKSLDANIQLVYNNAKLGALLAREYCQIK